MIYLFTNLLLRDGTLLEARSIVNPSIIEEEVLDFLIQNNYAIRMSAGDVALSSPAGGVEPDQSFPSVSDDLAPAKLKRGRPRKYQTRDMRA